MEVQRLSLLNINPSKPTDQGKSTRKPTGQYGEAYKSSQAGGEKSDQAGMLVSMSNTVADSKGIDLSDSRLSFAIDEDTGKTVINIVDNKTGDILRQIPPDDILKLKKRIGEIQGLLLDRKA